MGHRPFIGGSKRPFAIWRQARKNEEIEGGAHSHQGSKSEGP
jgi:hypothetical protein